MKDKILTADEQSVERIDPLTGVGNLLAFLETFTWRLAAEEWTDFSLLLVDLNSFNESNVEHGHAQGDGVLRWVSIAMKDLQAPVYRLGGDELATRGLSQLATSIIASWHQGIHRMHLVA